MPDDLSAAQGNILPPAVRRQAERADELLRQVAEEQKPESQEQGQPSEEQGQPQQGEQLELPLEGGEHRGEAPPAPVEQPPREQDVGYWRQRHDTLQGKYNSEISELKGRLRGLEANNTALQELLTRINAQPPAAPSSAPPKFVPPRVEIPAEDVEAYGNELIESARRWARAEVNPEIEQLKQEIQSLRGQTNMTSEEMRRQALHAELDAKAPEWRQLNYDADFIKWLSAEDPFAGKTRQELLGEAYLRGDATRTANIFQAYQREHTAVQPLRSPPAHTRAQSGYSGSGGAGSVPLADLAAPGRTRSGSHGAQSEKRLWSQKDIAAFYSDVRKGVYQGREADKARLEQDIFAAASEGRIR
jgi:hypothetical protein